MRVLSRCVAMLGVAFLACATPTSLCGCPPARTRTMITGTFHDAQGAPVVGARLVFERSTPGPVGFDWIEIGYGTDTQTNAAGAFHSLLYSMSGPGTAELRAGVVRAGMADTVWVNAGTVTFRHDFEDMLDTVAVDLHLP